MQHRVLTGTQRLFRAAAAAELSGSIWVITQGAQHVTDGDTVAPEQSSLWGFRRAAALEYPQVWGGLADLPGGFAEWPRLVAQVSGATPGEDQIALRERAFMSRAWLAARRRRNPRRCNCVPDASYLVTGGPAPSA